MAKQRACDMTLGTTTLNVHVHDERMSRLRNARFVSVALAVDQTFESEHH